MEDNIYEILLIGVTFYLIKEGKNKNIIGTGG